jgi:hypothetical protein
VSETLRKEPQLLLKPVRSQDICFSLLQTKAEVGLKDLHHPLPLILLLGDQARLFKQVFFYDSAVIERKKRNVTF